MRIYELQMVNHKVIHVECKRTSKPMFLEMENRYNVIQDRGT